MLNEQASSFFAERIKVAVALPARNQIGAESELGVASGLLAYALFAGDITAEQHQILQRHVAAAREQVVQKLMQPCGVES